MTYRVVSWSDRIPPIFWPFTVWPYVLARLLRFAACLLFLPPRKYPPDVREWCDEAYY